MHGIASYNNLFVFLQPTVYLDLLFFVLITEEGPRERGLKRWNQKVFTHSGTNKNI